MSSLPPLNAVVAFETAARHLSISKAAGELFVTHGAISKQIRVLEAFLGCELFIREHRKITLTAAGHRYLPHVQLALQTLGSATSELKQQQAGSGTLKINVLPSLSIQWLFPRLQEFRNQYPRLFVDLSIGDFELDFHRQDYDIAIRSSKKPPANCHFIKLMDEEMCLVAAPALAARLNSLDDLNQMTLLKHTSRPSNWSDWAKQAGVALTTEEKFGVEHFYMLAQAAASGMGVALIPRFFIEPQLADGSLVIPFDIPYRSDYCYYLLTPTRHKDKEDKIQALTQWLLALVAPYRITNETAGQTGATQVRG
ncbi:MAG: LysR substrate-binding domain-containing protein [Shewanella sp.]|nr:LysR substrate-binding domain-containing protein [Shewanella sp.]MCF1429606.1 LysR substrate-binding domain-containing protein [Shewanella sp.]MCF1437997.1 LysR substrate-binding domain-containing protein [Shewanella sp.]MCF1458385.1 LysR substrate-binding domain-containing protein [Shewanella sp.]